MTATEVLIAGLRYAAIAIVIRSVIVYSYRIFFHPLRKYPGPFIAKVTDWYGALNALLVRLHLAVYQDHQKYGPIVRHGPNKLVFNSITALHDIYQNDRLYKTRSHLVTQIKKGVYSIHNVLDKRLHRIKRRIIGEGVSEKSMRRFEPTMITEIDIFLKQLVERYQGNDTINMTDICKRLGMDVIGRLGFGYSLDLQTKPTNRFMVRGMAGGNYRNNVYIQFPLVKWMGIEVLLYPFLYAVRMRYFFLLKRLIVQRLGESKDAKADLFSFVIDAKDPETGEKIRLSELWSEVTFLFPAGGDTTSTAITALFFYLSRYPECYKKLATEIRSKFTRGVDIRSGAQLSSCSYLRACIDETMRMSPPVPGTLWRELASNDNEPLIIDGHSIPKGTWVGVNIYSLHHNEKYFPEPFTFKPERWLLDGDTNESDQAASKLMHEAFAPFSVGARSCAGKAMAYMEASIVMAKTLWYFDFERPNDIKLDKVGAGVKGNNKGRGREKEFQLYDIFASTHRGPNLMFRTRDDKWKELYEE